MADTFDSGTAATGLQVSPGAVSATSKIPGAAWLGSHPISIPKDFELGARPIMWLNYLIWIGLAVFLIWRWRRRRR